MPISEMRFFVIVSEKKEARGTNRVETFSVDSHVVTGNNRRCRVCEGKGGK